MFRTGSGLTIALILVSTFLNAGAQILLRLGGRKGIDLGDGPIMGTLLNVITRPAIFAGLLSYGVSVVIWIYVLSRAEASFAYPFLGLGFVIVALAGWLLLGEALTPARVAATGLIVAGVLLLAWN